MNPFHRKSPTLAPGTLLVDRKGFYRAIEEHYAMRRCISALAEEYEKLADMHTLIGGALDLLAKADRRTRAERDSYRCEVIALRAWKAAHIDDGNKARADRDWWRLEADHTAVRKQVLANAITAISRIIDNTRDS